MQSSYTHIIGLVGQARGDSQRLVQALLRLGAILVIVAVIITIVVQGHAVKLEEWIGHLVSGCGEATVQGHSRHLSRSTNVDTFALLDVSEVDGVDASASMRDNGRLHMANEGPLCGAEERVYLDIGSSGSSAESSILVLDQ